MNINIKKLIEKHKSKTKADIIDAEEMRVIIPVLLREIVNLEQKLADADKYIAVLETKKPILERKGESGKATWEVKYSTKQNRIYIKLAGVHNAKSAKIASNTIINILSHTQKNFDVITDASDLEAITDLKVLFHLKKVSFSLQQFNVGKIVRIIDKNNKTISKLFEKGLDDFANTISTVNSFEDATMLLDSKDSFLKQ